MFGKMIYFVNKNFEELERLGYMPFPNQSTPLTYITNEEMKKLEEELGDNNKREATERIAGLARKALSEGDLNRKLPSAAIAVFTKMEGIKGLFPDVEEGKGHPILFQSLRRGIKYGINNRNRVRHHK